MLTWIAEENKRYLLDAVRSYQRSLPKEGLITIHSMPSEGPPVRGNVPFIDVPMDALEILRMQGIAFYQTPN